MNWPVRKLPRGPVSGPAGALAGKLILVLALLAAGCLAAGCAEAGKAKDAVASAVASKSITVSPPTFSPTPSPTEAPTPTAEPTPETTTQSAAPAPASTQKASAAASTSPHDNAALWLLVVLGAILIALVVYFAARGSGRRSSVTADWRSRVADACAKGWALYDAISMAEAPEEMAPGAAGARWADIERRADDLGQMLYRLRETAPGEAEAARVSDVLGTLQGLRAAINSEHSPGEAGPDDHARVRSRLAFFEASLNELRRPTQSGI
jgi:hypothetical protein